MNGAALAMCGLALAAPVRLHAARGRESGPVPDPRGAAAPIVGDGLSGWTAADTLRGRVADESGESLEGVEVRISELGRVIVTDAEGRFRLIGVQAGRYTLTFRRPGYTARVMQVDVEGGTELAVELAITPFVLEDVVVTATGSPIQGADAPLPATTLSPDELRRYHAVSLAKTLEASPGVRSLSTGGQVGKPVIRGLSGSRVRVLVDGLPLEYESWSDEDAPSLDARLAERVEMIRGPASVLYGSDALGGVVNVIPAPVPETGGRGSSLKGGIETYGASSNREFGSVLGLEGASGRVGWRTTAIARHGDDLHTPAGELDNTGFFALNGEAAVGVHSQRGSATLRFDHYGGEFKLLEAGGNPRGPLGDTTTAEPEEGGPERKISDDRITLSGDAALGGLTLQTRAGWQRHWTAEFAEEGEAGGEPAGEGEEAEFELLLNTLTLRSLVQHDLGERIRGSVGISALYQDQGSEGSLPIVPDSRTLAGGVFAFEQLTAGALRVFAGARIDAHRLDVDASQPLDVSGETLDFTALTGSVGASLRAPAGLIFTGNVGRAWRAPTTFELFASGPRIGEARFEIGRSDLSSERSLNVDLGARWRRDRVSAEVHAYRNLIDDYIFLAPTGETRDGLRVFRHEQAKATLWGGEASLQVRPWRPLGLRGTYDFVRGTNRDTDRPLPLIPPRRGQLEAELHADGLAWARRAYLRAGLDLVAEQTRLSEFDVPTDGYELLELAAGVERRLGAWPLRLDVQVRNATDASYRDFLSRYKEFALDPGRDVLVRLSTSF